MRRHDVGARDRRQERRQRVREDLEVGGQEERDVAARGQEALELGRVAADVRADRVVDRAHERLPGRDLADLVPRAVRAAVVDEHDLVLALVRGERFDTQLDERLDVLPLVVGRDHEGDVHGGPW